MGKTFHKIFPRMADWMARRGKLKRVTDVRDEELRRTIVRAAETPKKREAMEKDVLLLEAAFATDATVASLDETVRTLFHQLAQEYEALRVIVWVNPVNEEEQPLEWLKTGAKPEKERRLGYEKI